jgi:hypothetical protein
MTQIPGNESGVAGQANACDKQVLPTDLLDFFVRTKPVELIGRAAIHENDW